MTDEDIAVALEGHGHEIKSLKHRMEEVEESNKALTQLATAVEVLATKQDAVGHNVETLTTKFDALASKPGKRWDGLVDKLIYAAVGAFIAWIIAGAPGL